MQCMAARVLMDLALDGERPPELGAHLADCPGCAEEWSSLLALEANLRQPGTLHPPPGFHARTMGRVELAAARPWRRRAEVRAGLSVLTVVLGCLLTVVGSLVVVQALRRPGEIQAWLDLLDGAGGWLVTMAWASQSQAAGLWAGLVSTAVALALALMWFGALVLPRQAPTFSGPKR